MKCKHCQNSFSDNVGKDACVGCEVIEKALQTILAFPFSKKCSRYWKEKLKFIEYITK